MAGDREGDTVKAWSHGHILNDLPSKSFHSKGFSLLYCLLKSQSLCDKITHRIITPPPLAACHIVMMAQLCPITDLLYS